MANRKLEDDQPPDGNLSIGQQGQSAAHYDALEFPDWRTVLLTPLCEGQEATVLQLPARPTSAIETDAQKRVIYVG